jgi:hypothetical protein
MCELFLIMGQMELMTRNGPTGCHWYTSCALFGTSCIDLFGICGIPGWTRRSLRELLLRELELIALN